MFTELHLIITNGAFQRTQTSTLNDFHPPPSKGGPSLLAMHVRMLS